MNNILLICKKELKSYFASPIAYILMAFFGLIFGFGFYTRHPRHDPLQLPGPDDGPAAQMNVNDQIIRPLLGFASTDRAVPDPDDHHADCSRRRRAAAPSSC